VKRAMPILTLAFLTACARPSTAPARLSPVPPPLTAALSAPCPPLSPLKGNSIADLVQADVDAALAYADCAARHAGAVNAYRTARDAAAAWNGHNSL
jgi:hypothetical protein